MERLLLLPHLAAVCKKARTDANVGAPKVAGEVPYKSDTSITRTFEGAQSWPADADAVVNAYAQTTGVSVFDLWDEAIRRAKAHDSGEPGGEKRRRLRR